METATPETTELTLQTLMGPYGGFFPVPAAGGVIGRAIESEVCLLHESIARRHASVARRGGSWFVIDHGSAAGTVLNGVRLQRDRPTPLASADLLRLGPWTFRVVLGQLPSMGEGETGASRTETTTTGGVMPAANWRLRLLSDCIAQLDNISGDEELGRAVLECAMEGTGYWSGAVLKPIDSAVAQAHEVSVVASVRFGAPTEVERRAGRSIVEAAWGGAVSAVPMGSLRPVTGQGVDGTAVYSVLCVPVLLGQMVMGFIYLDARGREQSVSSDAASFCEAVASAYGLALANHKRLDLERRQQLLAAELHAAREAQQFILPPPQGDLKFVRYAMEMRPGAFVAGDLFDAVPLDDGRVAVLLGDVAGHGAGSAMLMATTQSHLHAQLLVTRDPAAAVNEVNRYLAARITGGRFVSLWVGVFSPDGLVRWVDAGHGHWIIKPAGGPPRRPALHDSVPLGVDPASRYVSGELRLLPGDRIFVYSDGLVEQRGHDPADFGKDRLVEAIRTSVSAEEDVRHAFEAVVAFAGTPSLADDATAASIEFTGG